MSDLSRREFLRNASAAAIALGTSSGALAATAPFGPGDPYDLVIRGGDVLDPSQNLRAPRDIGIRNALIAAVEPEIPAAMAKQTLEANGNLVCPGLVDFHAHVFYR